MVFEALAIVIDIGVCKVQITGRAAADKRNREFVGREQRLRNEGFTAGYAVDVDHSEGVANAEAEGRPMFFDFPLDGLYTVIDRHFHGTAAQIGIRQGNMHGVNIVNHAFGE